MCTLIIIIIIIIIRKVIPDLYFNVTKLGIPYPTLSFNDNGDVNKNSKKAIGLDWQKKNSADATCFSVHFFAVSA